MSIVIHAAPSSRETAGKPKSQKKKKDKEPVKNEDDPFYPNILGTKTKIKKAHAEKMLQTVFGQTKRIERVQGKKGKDLLDELNNLRETLYPGKFPMPLKYPKNNYGINLFYVWFYNQLRAFFDFMLNNTIQEFEKKEIETQTDEIQKNEMETQTDEEYRGMDENESLVRLEETHLENAEDVEKMALEEKNNLLEAENARLTARIEQISQDATKSPRERRSAIIEQVKQFLNKHRKVLFTLFAFGAAASVYYILNRSTELAETPVYSAPEIPENVPNMFTEPVLTQKEIRLQRLLEQRKRFEQLQLQNK